MHPGHAGQAAGAAATAPPSPPPPARPPPVAHSPAAVHSHLLQDLHPRRTSPLTDEPTESPLAEITAALGSWLALLRNLSLATGAAAGASTAAAGLALLLFLLAATSLAPASDTVVLPLALDFSPTDLVGDAAFLPGALLVEGGGLSPADQQQLGVR